MVQGLDLPVVADKLGELARGGLFGGQAGDGVDRLDVGPAGFAVGTPAFDLDGLAGSGEEEAVHGGDLDPADLRAAVADAPGASLKRDAFPRKGLELPTRPISLTMHDGRRTPSTVGTAAVAHANGPVRRAGAGTWRCRSLHKSRKSSGISRPIPS